MQPHTAESRSREYGAQKLHHHGQPLVVEELPAAMSAAVNDLKLNGRARFLVSGFHFPRLLKRRLRVFIPMQKKQRGRMRIHMEDWAGKAREFGLLVRLAAEQKLERGDAHASAMRRRLLKDGGEVRHPEEAHNGLHIRRPAARRQNLRVRGLQSNTHQLSQVSARRGAGTAMVSAFSPSSAPLLRRNRMAALISCIWAGNGAAPERR